MQRVLVSLMLAALLAWLTVAFLVPRTGRTAPAAALPPAESRILPSPAAVPLPGEALMAGYGDPGTPPIEDLRKLQRVLSGYFSIVKDLTRHPIGGNADLSACLLGENANRQPFLSPEHPAIGSDRLLIDRWQTPLFVHPEAARELTLRSAGPDRKMFSDDDLVLLPNGQVAEGP